VVGVRTCPVKTQRGEIPDPVVSGRTVTCGQFQVIENAVILHKAFFRKDPSTGYRPERAVFVVRAESRRSVSPHGTFQHVAVQVTVVTPGEPGAQCPGGPGRRSCGGRCSRRDVPQLIAGEAATLYGYVLILRSFVALAQQQPKIMVTYFAIVIERVGGKPFIILYDLLEGISSGRHDVRVAVEILYLHTVHSPVRFQ